MLIKLNPYMPTLKAKKTYIEREAERIQFDIAHIGSEGVCSHCKYQDVCLYSTTINRTGMSRSECDGYERTCTLIKFL